MIKDYEPTEADLAHLNNIIATVRDGGVWAIPMCGLIYRIDRAAKTLASQPPTAWMSTPLTMLTHHHNQFILAKLGWKISPVVDWSKTIPEEVTT